MGAPGTFGGGLPSQNVVPFADFASFSVDGFTFTGIYAGLPPGFCFSGSLQSFNGSQILPPNTVAGFHQNAGSVFWQASLDGGGIVTGNCLFPYDNGQMTYNVNQHDITALKLIAETQLGSFFAADWALTSWDGSTSPATSSTPEPGTLVLLGSGLIAAAGRLRKRLILQ